MDFSVIWLKEPLKENEDIQEILKDIYNNYGQEDTFQWKILDMQNSLDPEKPAFNGQEDISSQTDRFSSFHPTELCVAIHRTHNSKSSPFCNSIYGLTDQLLSLQLVMAQNNKQETGQYEADLQDVIMTHQQIMQIKLNRSSPNSNKTQGVLDNYNTFLQHCNAMDYADLINSLKECFNCDTSRKDLYEGQHYVFYGMPASIIEMEILLLLLGSRNVLQFSSKEESVVLKKEEFEEFIKQHHEHKSSSRHIPDLLFTPVNPKRNKIDNSLVTPQNLTSTDNGVSSPLQSQSPILSQCSFSQGRMMMGHALSVFMSYLQLLLNSRDELALARIINTPSRELGIRQFDKIKKVAREKNMTMFQVVTSFILQIHLGGKSYAPSDDNPLHLMTKGLGEFVYFFQNLQNIIEETDEPKSAIVKVIGALQSTLLKAGDETLSRDDIRRASNYLKKQIDTTVNDDSAVPTMENKSCMIGLESYVFLRKLLDRNILYDYEEKELCIVLKTPKRIGKTCSLLSKFRTPEAPTPTKVQEVQDRNNLKDQKQQSLRGETSWTKLAITKRTSIWQDIDEPIIELEQEHHRQPCAVVNTTEIASRKRPLEQTCGAFKDKTHSPLRKRPHESQEYQENIQLVPTEKGTIGKPTAKRGLLAPGKQGGGNKKRSGNKSVKSKAVKMVKGQQQLTCFFR